MLQIFRPGRYDGTSQPPTYSCRACGKVSPPQYNLAKAQGYVVASSSRSHSFEDHQPELELDKEREQHRSRTQSSPQMNCAKRQEVVQVVPLEQRIHLVQSDVADHDVVLGKQWLESLR